MPAIPRNDPRIIETFDKLYQSISTKVAFNPKWRWVASLRGAIHDLENKLVLENGERVKCVDDLDRRAVFLGTPLGTITLFERPRSRGQSSVVFEVPEVFCESNLFVRSSDAVVYASLEYILSPLFAQAMDEVAAELETA